MERKVLFWSKRFEKKIPKELWDYDSVYEVEDQLDTMVVDQMAQVLTATLREELAKVGENGTVKIVHLGPSIGDGILEHVLDNIAKPTGAEVCVLKRKGKEESSPKFLLDQDKASEVLESKGA